MVLKHLHIFNIWFELENSLLVREQHLADGGGGEVGEVEGV